MPAKSKFLKITLIVTVAIFVVAMIISFILNEIKHKKFDSLRKTKITVQQEKIIEGVERDLDVCVTKIGLLLHAKEL